MTLNKASLAVALLLASGSMMPAVAADLAPMPETSEWRFTIAPYAWGVGLSGDVGVFGRGPVEIDIPFSDIIQDLNFAAMAAGEMHNGTWGVFFDVNYTSLSADASKSRVLERVPASAEVKAEVDVTEFIGTIMGQYRAIDSDQATLDVMAGGRYWNVQNDVSVKATVAGDGPAGIVLSRDLSGSDGASWVDPMVGAKARINTSMPVYFTGWGMVGGFGVGSDFSWDVMGGVGYEWTEKFSTVLGYRALGVDYENDGFVFDVVQQGVALGAVFNF
jgi:opacity protein-like surface antigen